MLKWEDFMNNVIVDKELSPLTFVFAVTIACVALVSSAVPVRIDVKAGDSLVAVRDRVRSMPMAEKMNGVEIVLAPGEYVVEDGLELTATDNGASAAAPIVWRAADPGTARIVGAARIPVTAFEKVTEPDVLARLPENGRGKVYAVDVSAFCPKFISPLKEAFSGKPTPPFVFMDGRLATLAAYPNGGKWMSFVKRVYQGTPIPGQKNRFTGGAFVCDDPRLSRWDFSKGVWLNGYFTHDWFVWTVKVASYGAENGTNGVIRIGEGTPVPYGVMSGTWGRKDRRFRAINLFEELDEPGEWWLDRERKILFVVPPDGSMADSTDIRIAFLEAPLVRGRNLSNLRFRGIDFFCAYNNFVDFGESKGVAISDCRFTGTARNAISIAGTSNVVSRCEISQCGGGGVSMAGGSRKTLTRSDSIVEQCRIHDIGILQRTYAGGVALKGCGLVLRGCEIFNAPHLAVAFEGNELLIESNDVHHVVTETGDAGAFYTGRDWTTQGNVLRYNFVHDLGKGTTQEEGDDAAVSGTNVMGFYFDDCDCGDDVYGNVFMNCPRGILIGGGREHPVRNNVFINCNLGLSIDCRGIKWKNWNVPGGNWYLEGKAQKFSYTTGVWAERYPRLANIMNDHPREPLYNPIKDNVFIDCRSLVDLKAALKCDDDGTAPGLMSRIAPISGNTVIYTKGADKIPRQKLDPRIADGFRVFEVGSSK